MPASTIADRRHILFDKLLELRAYTAAALSATGSEAAILFAATRMMDYVAVVTVAAHTGYTAGTNQWTITVEASTVAGSGFVPVGSVIPAGVAGTFTIPLSGSWVQSLKPGAIYLRVTATKAGTAGNLVYSCFLSRERA